MIAELPVEQVHEPWPSPDGDDLPATIEPAVLLPHNPPKNPFTFVDFDDVPDPEPGTIPIEVAVLLDKLGGYAEVSRSGQVSTVGFEAASLVITSPILRRYTRRGILKSTTSPGTWAHIEDTPLDRVPNAQNTLKRLVTTYAQ